MTDSSIDINSCQHSEPFDVCNKAHISFAAWQHNLQTIKKKLHRQRILAVVKADAYGHGLLPLASFIEKNAPDISGLAVANIHEAALLRDAGISLPMVCLSGFRDRQEALWMVKKNCIAVVHDVTQLDILKKITAEDVGKCRLQVWLKCDTGMHRLGFAASAVAEAMSFLCFYPMIDRQQLVLMTHLAIAEDADHHLTRQQWASFEKLAREYDCATSIANSAAIWCDEHDRLSDDVLTAEKKAWLRVGLALYGVSPLPDSTANDLNLQAVMTLSSKIIAIKSCERGGAVGYGASYIAERDMTLAVVGIGYADGYPREWKRSAVVLLHGVRCAVVGRVSMDMLTIDVSGIPNAQAKAQVGDRVILWGDGLAIEEVAMRAGTIPYTLLTRVGRRVRRVYHHAEL